MRVRDSESGASLVSLPRSVKVAAWQGGDSCRAPRAGERRATLAAVRRPVIALVLTLVAIAVFAGGLAWLLDTPRPPAGASRGERFYYAYCVTCHGTDGRGSWRASLFLIRPGDLSDAARMSHHTDQYLFDIIEHGGAPLGRPGMPAFGFHLSDDDLAALIRHVRSLAQRDPQRSTSIRSSTSSASR